MLVSFFLSFLLLLVSSSSSTDDLLPGPYPFDFADEYFIMHYFDSYDSCMAGKPYRKTWYPVRPEGTCLDRSRQPDMRYATSLSSSPVYKWSDTPDVSQPVIVTCLNTSWARIEYYSLPDCEGEIVKTLLSHNTYSDLGPGDDAFCGYSDGAPLDYSQRPKVLTRCGSVPALTGDPEPKTLFVSPAYQQATHLRSRIHYSEEESLQTHVDYKDTVVAANTRLFYSVSLSFEFWMYQTCDPDSTFTVAIRTPHDPSDPTLPSVPIKIEWVGIGDGDFIPIDLLDPLKWWPRNSTSTKHCIVSNPTYLTDYWWNRANVDLEAMWADDLSRGVGKVSLVSDQYHWQKSCLDTPPFASDIHPMNTCHELRKSIVTRNSGQYHFGFLRENCPLESMYILQHYEFKDSSQDFCLPVEHTSFFIKSVLLVNYTTEQMLLRSRLRREDHGTVRRLSCAEAVNEASSEDGRVLAISRSTIFLREDHCISGKRGNTTLNLIPEGTFSMEGRCEKHYSRDSDAEVEQGGVIVLSNYTERTDCLGTRLKQRMEEYCTPAALFYCVGHTCFGEPFESKKVCSGYGACTAKDYCLCFENSWLLLDETDCHVNGINWAMYVVIGLGLLIAVLCIVAMIICLAYCVTHRKIDRYESIDDLDVIMDLHKQDTESSNDMIAKLKIDHSLFEINYDDVQVKGRIGVGGSGAGVFMCRWRGLDCAFKCWPTMNICGEQSNFDAFEREVSLLASLRHPNVLTFFGALLRPPRIGYVMEYCPKGDLLHHLRNNPNYSYANKLRICLEISSAMSFLHSSSVIHRDLKPENVLLTETETSKLCDFGISRIVRDLSADKTTRIGTKKYMAPEMTKSEDYSNKVDVFAFGILAYEIFTENFNPFDVESTMQLEYRIAHNPGFRPKFEGQEDWFRGSEELMRLCAQCWDDNPNLRPTFDEALELMQKLFAKTVDD